jgi:DNA-binding LacI/PurR family transcriptional regulator
MIVTALSEPRRAVPNIDPQRRLVMTDIARLAGVSQKTVSRVVNGSPNVSEEVRARVTAVIEEQGFRPNNAARALASRRSGVIGIVTLGSALYGSTAQVIGVERAARARGYSTVLVSTPDGQQRSVVSALEQIANHGVDGIILSEPGDDWRLDPGLLRGIPLVSIGSGDHLLDNQVVVGYDQLGGARRGTEHLIALGHRQIAHIAGPADFPDSAARQRGWEEALAAAGLEPGPLLHGDWTAASGYEAGRSLAQDAELTAVFVANDRMAIGVQRAMHEAGLTIPGDVSIVGFDDIPEAEFQMIPLTTLRQDFARTTTRAVEKLLEIMRGKRAQGQRINYIPELIVRRSSGPAISSR